MSQTHTVASTLSNLFPNMVVELESKRIPVMVCLAQLQLVKCPIRVTQRPRTQLLAVPLEHFTICHIRNPESSLLGRTPLRL